nr:MAG: hypothetical protein [Bacteriophage sp.]
MIMAIIMHPLTARNGSPEYTADDYRHAINPLLLPSDGSAFNGLSGIRYGSPSPLVTVSGLTATVKAHCGTISPWDGLGAYTYAITTNTTVQLADSTNNYKIAVTVEDPSQSHGTTPCGQLKVFTAGTPDSNINGLVIAKVNAGVASDVAPMIRNSAILMAHNLEQLNTIDAVNGQEAVTITDNVHYVRNGGVWKLERKTITFGSVERNTVVGTVPNVGNISHAYGMVLLGSGSAVPLTFFHPNYPNRAASFSINASGQIIILYGSENTLQRGRITICWEY